MHVGTISKLCHEGKYGKIITKDGEEVHFHKGCLWNIQFDQLNENQEIEFELQTSYNGFIAFHIRPLVKNAEMVNVKGQT